MWILKCSLKTTYIIIASSSSGSRDSIAAFDSLIIFSFTLLFPNNPSTNFVKWWFWKSCDILWNCFLLLWITTKKCLNKSCVFQTSWQVQLQNVSWSRNTKVYSFSSLIMAGSSDNTWNSLFTVYLTDSIVRVNLFIFILLI